MEPATHDPSLLEHSCTGGKEPSGGIVNVTDALPGQAVCCVGHGMTATAITPIVHLLRHRFLASWHSRAGEGLSGWLWLPGVASWR